MKIEQRYWTENEGWQTEGISILAGDAQWVLVFGGVEKIREPAWLLETKQRYPKALIMGCSTAGDSDGKRRSDQVRRSPLPKEAPGALPWPLPVQHDARGRKDGHRWASCCT